MWDEINGKSNVINYVNDVLITTTIKEENLKILDSVLSRIQETGLIINLVKAQML